MTAILAAPRAGDHRREVEFPPVSSITPALAFLAATALPAGALAQSGFGYMVPLAKYVALKVETRGYATLVDSTGGFFCSGGCVVQIKGTTFTQGEVMAGISARF
jgi:hypothetical protein